MVFIGAGRDSTSILHNGNIAQCFYLRDSSLLQGIYLHGRTDTSASGIITFHLAEGVLAFTDQSAVVKGCRFSDMRDAFQALFTDDINPDKRVVLENNEFSRCFQAVRYWFCSSRVLGNTFYVNYSDIGNSIQCRWANTAEIRDNLFIRTVPFSSPAIELGKCDSIWVANNICLSFVDDAEAIRINGDFSGYPTHGVIENNLCAGGWGGILSNGGDIRIRNNIIMQTTDVALFYPVATTTPGYVGYNLYWKNEHRNAGDKAFWPDPGNLFANPMFVDSMDFHLQAFSPAIDAGDPSLLDADGSRSDIGPFGGPYGETYVYQDLAPATPTGFAARYIPTDTLLFTWRANHEADLDHYELDVEGSPCFPPFDSLCGTFSIASADSSFVYVNAIIQGEFTYSFNVRAVDAQGHSSAPSNTLYFANAAVGDEDVRPDRFELRQNYPNPFNAETRIEYTLARPSGITLTVYDALGRRVETLVQGTQSAGEHALVWDAKDRGSGVYFLVLETPTDRRVKKALLLK